MSKRSIGRFTERKEQDKLWRPCQDFETPDPVGKLCNRTCTNRKGKDDDKCKEWKTTVKDFKLDFDFFRNGSFVMIDEDEFL